MGSDGLCRGISKIRPISPGPPEAPEPSVLRSESGRGTEVSSESYNEASSKRRVLCIIRNYIATGPPHEHGNPSTYLHRMP